jgi:hypothetical protein
LLAGNSGRKAAGYSRTWWVGVIGSSYNNNARNRYGASNRGFSPTIGFPSIRRPNGTYKIFRNSLIIAYLGNRQVDKKSVVSIGEC